METNLNDIMSKVSELEREFSELGYELRSESINIKTIELDGKEQTLEEYPEFMNKFHRYEYLVDEITRLKGIIFERNNTLTLKNGYTIQKALVLMNKYQKELELVRSLNKQIPSKNRRTEVNNSYFISKELAYNKDDMKEKEIKLIEKIENIKSEINSLNALTFTIAIN